MSENATQNNVQNSSIHKKMLAIKDAVGAIGKDQRGDGIRYTYRGIDALYNALHDAMLKHGVVHYPQVIPGTYVREYKELQGKNGIRLQTHVSYILALQFVDVDTGQAATVTVPAEGYDDSDKAAGKAVSYGMKSALAHALGIPTELDPDSERPDTSQDPEAVISHVVRKMTLAADRDEALAAYKAAPDYARKHPDVKKATEAVKSRFA